MVRRIAGDADAGAVCDSHQRQSFRSRPSRALTATTLAIVLVGILLPYTPFAAKLGFAPLPPIYFVFLAAATVTYLLLVEIGKRILMRKTLRGA